MINRDLTLGYNLLNVGQVDNFKLGSIQVTAIFRPVASARKSGVHDTGKYTGGGGGGEMFIFVRDSCLG